MNSLFRRSLLLIEMSLTLSSLLLSKDDLNSSSNPICFKYKSSSLYDKIFSSLSLVLFELYSVIISLLSLLINLISFAYLHLTTIPQPKYLSLTTLPKHKYCLIYFGTNILVLKSFFNFFNVSSNSYISLICTSLLMSSNLFSSYSLYNFANFFFNIGILFSFWNCLKLCDKIWSGSKPSSLIKFAS